MNNIATQNAQKDKRRNYIVSNSIQYYIIRNILYRIMSKRIFARKNVCECSNDQKFPFFR